MAEMTEASYSVSFKTNRGTLVTVRGNDAEEFAENLAKASVPIGKDGGTVLEMIAAIDTALSAPAVRLSGRPAAPAAPSAQPGTAKPADPLQELPEQDQVKCETCQAPAKFEQQGFSSKSGKPYRRYSCTANQLHKATFTEA